MDVEEHVLRLVSEERGVQPVKLKLSDRLNLDLGMDGDDAVEFFERFETEFNVDCSQLQSRWTEFFGPESAPGVSVFATGLVVAMPAVAISILLHLPAWACVLLALGFLAAWAQFNTSRARKNPASSQITIAQLVEGARTKRLSL